jgi:hypothetical protein
VVEEVLEGLLHSGVDRVVGEEEGIEGRRRRGRMIFRGVVDGER